MLKSYIENSQKQLQKNNTNFYSTGGLHVYFYEPLLTDEPIDVEAVVAKAEGVIPAHLRQEIDMIMFGQFEEFEEQSINAFYKDGALYISNVQDDEQDLYDDIVHEIAHASEEQFGYEIYGDQRVKEEFLRKRERMHDILWAAGYKIPLSLFTNVEYDEELDMFLYESIGYDKLSTLLGSLFISPYAATSLREYYATAFTYFYIHSDHTPLEKNSPQVYAKLLLINDEEKLDN